MNIKNIPFIKLVIAFLACAGCLASAHLLPGGSVISLSQKLSYWVMVVAFAALIWFLWQQLREVGDLRAVVRRHRWGLLVILACTIYLHLHEPHRFKVLNDEHVLSAIGWQMHLEREAALPMRAHFVDGHFSVFEQTADKRPPLFSFLQSLVHDVSGYRPENVFFVNAVLGILLLALLYGLGVLIGGQRYGILAVLLMTSFPLLAQNVTGGGFEVLNLVMVTALILTGHYYWNQPGTKGMNLFVVAGVLLALSRYESVLFLIAVAILIACKWGRERRISLTWFTCLSPLLVAPNLWGGRAFTVLGLREFKDVPFFNLDRLADNIGHALYFMFSFDDLSNSFLLAALGIPACLFLVVLMIRALTRGVPNPADAPLYIVLAVGFLVSALLLSLNWGFWDDPMVSRFALLPHLIFVLAIVRVLKEMLGERVLPIAAAGAVGAFTFLVSTPINASHWQTNEIHTTRDWYWFKEWVDENLTERDLVVMDSPLGAIIYGQPATSFQKLAGREALLQAAIDFGFYDRIFFFERHYLDITTGQYQPYTIFGRPSVSDSVARETISESRYRVQIVSRITQFKGYTTEAVGEAPALPTGFSAVERATWLYEVLP